MPRNFYRRVEIVFPVEDDALRHRLRDEILEGALSDNVKARCIQPDGTHTRPKSNSGEPHFRCQRWFLELAGRDSDEYEIADFMAGRSAAPPALPSESTPATETAFLTISPRAAPQSMGPVSTDGRAGTSADPVLQSMAAERQGGGEQDEAPLRHARESTPREEQARQAPGESERPVTTVVSEEAPAYPTPLDGQPPRPVKSGKRSGKTGSSKSNSSKARNGGKSSKQ
jgi:hypothetical protein